jgi:uncharacterized protein (TIGR00251 family)
MAAYVERPGGIVLHVRVQPRSSRDEIAGIHDGRLKLRITAPPVDGAANAACQKLLAGVLGVSKSAIRLIAGQKAREKSFEISGDPAALKARLATFEESV